MSLLVNVLLDRSGSMQSLASDVLGHFNEYVNGLKELDENVYVSLSIFDDQYDNVYSNTKVEDVKPLTKDIYYARGNTALLDAVGRIITAAESADYKPEDKVLFVIHTDGFENASHEYTKAKVKALVEKHADWQFLFIGAGLDNFDDAFSMGISRGYSTTHTSRGTGYGYFNAINATSGWASGQSATITDAMDASINSVGTEDEYAKNNPTPNPN